MAASPQLRAKFAYKGGAAENFVSFEADDRFTLLNKDDAGWWRVRNANNQEMYVPATYVEEIVEESTDSQEAVQGNGKKRKNGTILDDRGVVKAFPLRGYEARM